MQHIGPKLSILAFTFNHERWVAQALDSLLAQKTTFPIEILVLDDASTDGTVEIIKEYERQFPGLITGVYLPENQYSKGGFSPLLTLFKHATGKYIAMCECDDFWTDPLKCQKQVELLEAHPECSMSVAQTDLYQEDGDSLRYLTTYRGLDKEILSFEDVLGCYFHTSTYVVPAGMMRALQTYQSRIKITDTTMRYILLHLGPYVFLPEVVSVYRIRGGGMWSALDEVQRLKAEIQMAEMLYEKFEPQYRHHFAKRLLEQYLSLIILDIKRGRLNALLEYSPKFGSVARRSSPRHASKLLFGRTFAFLRRVTGLT
jgi:glycosyltransferase involved in cell wall biosynthesis